MPNHTENCIMCGDKTSWDHIRSLFKGVNVQGEQCEFTYNALIPCPKTVYQSNLSSVEMKKRGEHNCWYDWNHAHWGVKWDAYDVMIYPELMRIEWLSPWGPPTSVIDELVWRVNGMSWISFTYTYRLEGDDDVEVFHVIEGNLLDENGETVSNNKEA